MNIMDRERTLFVEITPTIRRRLEATVENIIALLDELDGDADGEDGGDQEGLPEEIAGEFDEADMIDDDFFSCAEASLQPVHLPGGNGD
ncbi:hypothetical protein SAMN06265338_103276 [Rhodoblastus acidophilus]|uniref:Uncharacterized protein n=1 Tax=Rhodoblastus acidophilus TaxID=1074 RepID=A0A212RBW3_RHOAC|nr:hypothetical protein [Rhodoblastus acidophilus]PPQ39425.1 hypothetical protein CKO16_06645 [Rhodoblastus acidophilus]RAI19447.1 hypothetical protein CH337_11835 [Rhodoblastus acidophilus]SNB69712.1 hypothetical protein SAMN06265338_103276 [Rhodoblastus acidophilus]